jgi:hypothetical protein
MIRKLLCSFLSVIFSNSSKKKSFAVDLRLLCLGMFFVFNTGFSQANTWLGGSGNAAQRINWFVDANWSKGTIPVSTDNVVIPNATNKPTIASGTAVCASLTIDNTGGNDNILTITSPGVLNVTGAIIMTSPTGGNPRNTTISVSNGTLTAGSISMSDSGSASDNRDCRLLLSTGSATISGNISMNPIAVRSDITFSGAGTLNVGGTITGGTLGTTTGTVNYNGNSQNVGTYTYNNLILSNSGTKTLAGSVTTNGALTLNNNTSLDMSTYLLTLNGNLVNGGTGTITGTTGGVTISGGNTQSIAGFTTTGNVTMSKTGNTATLTGAMNGGNLTVNGAGANLALGTFTHTFTGSWAMTAGTLLANSSTLRVQGDLTGGGNFTSGTGTVELYGSNQSITQPSFYNLTLSGTGTKTFTAATAMSNNLVIGSGVKANLGSSLTHSANTLSLGGTTQDLGSWGSTGSSASNKNDTYFTVANSGVVNIGKTYCTFNFTGVRPITNVVFNTISNASSALTTSPAYENYINYKTNVTAGQSYTISVQGFTNGGNTYNYTVFFDWNQDGDFADSGESFNIGTINNSTGIDGKSTSVSIAIPSSAVLGTTRMRVISHYNTYNTTPCASVDGNSNGQVEDYSVNIQAACSGTPAPGLTNATANPVCPNVPFTLSVQSPSSGGATYQWESSSTGSAPWNNVSPSPVTIINTNFTTAPTNATTLGVASITGGELILTPTSASSSGGYLINTTPGSNITPFTASFDYRIWDGTGADGMSLSYGPSLDAATVGGGEKGEGAGFILQLDTYDNDTGQNTGSMIRILYGGVQIFANSLNPFNLRNSSYRNVTLSVDANGLLSLKIAGTVIVSGLSVPSYVADDKTNWKFKFSARNGDQYDKHSIDNLSIQCGDVLSTNSTLTTSQTVATYYRAKVTCGTNSGYSTPVQVNMSAVVITSQPTSPTTTCSGTGTQILTVAATGTGLTYSWRKGTTVLVNGPVISGQGTPTLTLTNATTTEAGLYNVIVTGGCSSTVTSDNVNVTIDSRPTSVLSGTGATCSGTARNISVAFTGTGPWDFTYSDGATLVSFTGISANPYTISVNPSSTKTYTITALKDSKCTAIASDMAGSATVIVNPLATVTLNKTDETCASSNNGTITPVLSGGLTNVRYIKLTQKYVNAAAWQQVAEIQAFEIFTGTNVALAANGASATASSTYSNNPSVYGAQRAIDGLPNSFWHSATPNINEYIIVDLASAKNLDYLRIYNREDCCQERGQNMLLELLDASNNVMYSKTVDLFENILNPHYIDVNVLDISWGDPATTLNRTGLDAGTYTLNYSDAAGCSTSSQATIATTNPNTSITTQPSVSAICAGSNTSFSVVASGAALTYKWELSTDGGTNFSPLSNGGVYSNVTSSTMNITGATASMNGYQYRVVVTGTCSTVTSAGVALTVNIAPSITSQTLASAICAGSNTLFSVTASGTGLTYQWMLSTDGGTSFGSLLNQGVYSNVTSATMNITGATASMNGYKYVVTINGQCNPGITSNIITLTVNDKPTVTPITTPTALCVGGSLNMTTPTATANGSAITSQGWQIETGVSSGAYTSLTLPYTVALADDGKTIRYSATSSCGITTSNSVTLKVNANPTAPVASPTQPTCAQPTGTITVSSPAPGAGISYGLDGTTFPNTNGVFTGLTDGVYTVYVKNGSGCIASGTPITIASTGAIVWTGNTSTDWNTASNWLPQVVPGLGDCVLIPNTGAKNSVISTDVSVHSILVNNGGSLTVLSDKILTVTEGIIVGTSGSFVFENNSSLIQKSTSNSINIGNITYKRKSAPVRRYDFTFWSSPVKKESAFTLKKLSPLTLGDKYYSYNTTTLAWKIDYNGTLTMIPGNGYIVRAPQNFDITATAIYPASFIGTPNNGDIEITPVADHSYLLGNPYPSALDGKKFIKDNSDAGNDVGALYFWTHNSPPSDTVLGDAKYNYTVNDYAVYSLVGGVATGPAKTGGSEPTGVIAAGQAFFATPSTNVKIKFTNDMRIGAGNSQFFKTKGSDETEQNRLWLNFTNAKGAFKQVLVGYVEGATNGWDTNYDGWTMSGNTYLDFYSINDADKLTIQGRALPFEKTDLVPLGYVTSIAGDFTIAIDHADGVFTSQAVYLEDKKTGQIIDLRAGNYTFTTAIGTFPDRFVLRYTNKTLGTGDFENIENGVLVSSKDKTIKVQSSVEVIKEVTIFDVAGKLVYNKKKVTSNELQITNLQAANQVLLINITLENGFTTTRKVIFQ